MKLDITTVEIGPKRAVLALSGEVDLSTAPTFKQELTRVIESGATDVVVDLSATTFIDSTALGVLISGLGRVRPQDGNLLLVIADRNIEKVFVITGLDRVLPIYSTRSDAIEALDLGTGTIEPPPR